MVLMEQVTVQQLAAQARADLGELVDRVLQLLLAAEPEGFFDDGNQRDLRDACLAGLTAVLTVLSGEIPTGTDPLDVPREAGRRQVQQDLPLEGVLRAYRLAGRAIWEHLVTQARRGGAEVGDALLDGASEVWRVIDACSGAVGESYRREEEALRTRDQRARSSLLAALLDGHGSDPVFARDAARALGLDAAEDYVCVVGLSGSGAPVALDSPEERLLQHGVRSVWLGRPAGEVGLVSLSGIGPSRLLDLVNSAARGRVGVSQRFPSLADLPYAERVADIAARLSASTGARTVDTDLLAALVVDSPIVAAIIRERTVGALQRTAKGDAGAMLDTVRCFLAADGQLTEAAHRAFLHRNTLLYRLNKVERLTGWSARELQGQLLWRLGLLAHDSNV